MSTGFYRDRLGLESENHSSSAAAMHQSMTRTSRTTATAMTSASAYSSSSLSRQEVRSSSDFQQQRETNSSRGHYAVSSHVSNGSLVVDNGQGVIQQGTHGIYEENLSKFKGQTKLEIFSEQLKIVPFSLPEEG